MKPSDPNAPKLIERNEVITIIDECTATVCIEVDTKPVEQELTKATEAAKRFNWTWRCRCGRCHERDQDLTGIDKSLCAECEHRAAVRTITALMAAMVVLSIAMITLGRIG